MPAPIRPYLLLARLDRPVGIWLLFLPGAWGILLGCAPWRDTVRLLVLFAIGSIVMLSAGCVVNDMWDRDLDRQVRRTASRPLASGALRMRHALGVPGFAAVRRAVRAAAAQPHGAGARGKFAAARSPLSPRQASDLVAATGHGLHLRRWRTRWLRRSHRPHRRCLVGDLRRSHRLGPRVRHDLRLPGHGGRRPYRSEKHLPAVRPPATPVRGRLLRRDNRPARPRLEHSRSSGPGSGSC